MLWEKTVGSEYSKYRCVVKIGLQKKSLRKGNIILEKTTITIITASLGPWGVEKGVVQQSGSTQSGAEETETQNINVVGKTTKNNKYLNHYQQRWLCLKSLE